MIRVGFIGTISKEWMGGFNYFKNLLFAISTLTNKEIEPIVFLGKKTDEDTKAMFRKHVQVIEHPMFDSKSIPHIFMRISQKLFKTNYLLDRLLQKHQIDILSHADLIKLTSCKTINWIPDFQHLHLPQMFSNLELEYRNRHFLNLAKHSDSIILSSLNALKDFNRFAPTYSKKAEVLQFVSQPDPKYFKLTAKNEEDLRRKFDISTPFFYLPNQFWKHKNHLIVFEAVSLLKKKGIYITVICTGHLHDHRHKDYLETLTNYLNMKKINNQIKLLGMVDYEDVFALIKFSEAVINPSLFEGWSSSVEECKSVGKTMILSDLDVHREQYPNALFFERHNVQSLINVLETYTTLDKLVDISDELQIRTRQFAETYQNIVKKVLS